MPSRAPQMSILTPGMASTSTILLLHFASDRQLPSVLRRRLSLGSSVPRLLGSLKAPSPKRFQTAPCRKLGVQWRIFPDSRRFPFTAKRSLRRIQ